MFLPLAKLLLIIIVFGLIVFGLVRQFLVAGWITSFSEINALRSVEKNSGPISKEHSLSRNRQIYILQALLISYDFNPIPVLRITSGLLLSLAPLIEEALAATGTPDHHRTALAGLKERMKRKGIWPDDPGFR